MNGLYNELRVEVFKYTEIPISLLLTNREWYALSKDPHVRAEWLIYKYGKAHALFHAIRLAGTFTTLDVIRSLLAKKVIVSRYFIQRLLMQFGNFDQQLIDLKIEYSANQINFEKMTKIKNSVRLPWASKLPLPIFNHLLTEAPKILKDDNLAIKGNDMELFHFLTAGSFSIGQAFQKLHQNIDDIKDLILNKKFMPFPPRPRNDAIIYEEYPPRDGYESQIHFNVITRAILIYPEIVNMWKSIGYQICSDVNDMVIRGGLLVLFPPTPPPDWKRPDVDTVVSYLKQLTDIGFKLHEKLATESLNSFENDKSEISEILLNGFKIINPEIAITCDAQIEKIKQSNCK